MIKRPLDPRFRDKVLAGVKTTTIREKPWPVGVPIMLYSWIGLPYRSKQDDLVPVVAWHTGPIKITHRTDGGMLYAYECHDAAERIHESEGFASREEMDAWFRPLVKPGQTVTKRLMRFRLCGTPAEHRPQTLENTAEREGFEPST
jgi:hypothetical protein